jgi:hypothetical protein
MYVVPEEMTKKVIKIGGRTMKKFLCVLFMGLLIVGSTGVFSKVKVGQEVLERFETQHPYPAEKGVVFEKSFYYPNAGYIAIHFSEFDLAKGDIVQISSPDGRFVYEYSEKGKKIRNRKENTEEFLSNFWATHIPGDELFLRLISKNNRTAGGFVIDKWVHGFEAGYIQALVEEDEFYAQIEAICGTDDKEWAKCYDGTEMYNKAKAVCRLLIGGSSACTGWLLGSEGHVITNNHCIENQNDASDTDYEFMAEGATCNTNCASWGACPGVVAASSGTLIQTDSSLDYSLILLPTNVTSTYGYLQFRNTLPIIDERIYIPQHPGAYGKQIAVESTHATDPSGYGEIYTTSATPCSGGPGDIGYYADTEGGSSGSPVIAYEDHFVVALHHCANCPNRGVPIPSIISDLGANLPNDAIGSTIPDTDPPVISGVNAVDITDTTARIVWTTDESSDSVVYYGLTTGYGNIESNPAMVTAHSVNLNGLIPNTPYHYKVESTDSSDNTGQSIDFIFSTLPETQDPEIFVYDISMQKFSWWIFYRAEGTITIKDTDNSVVPNATVYIQWSGKASGIDSGTTDPNGQITFNSGWYFLDGTFTITVTNVTHPTLQYNPALNNETSDSI